MTAATTTTAPVATSPSTRSVQQSRTGLEREIGSVEVGKMADLVLWQSALFGVRPTMVCKEQRWGLARPHTARVSRVAGAAGPVGDDELRLHIDVGSGATWAAANALLAQVGEFVRGERAH